MSPEEREALRTKVAQAIGEAFGGACLRQDGACAADLEFCGCQRATDAALAVAEPVVRADEREACWDVAINEMLAAEADVETSSDGDLVARLQSQGAASAAGRIATFLRARGAAAGEAAP